MLRLTRRWSDFSGPARLWVLVLAVSIAAVAWRFVQGHGPVLAAWQAPTMGVEMVNMQHRLSQFALNPPQASDTVLLGDSLTHEGEWAEWLGPGHLNRGIRGEGSDGLAQRLPQTLPTCPASIHLLIGTNDLHRRMALNESAPERAQVVAQAHARAVAAVRRHCPQARLRVQALLPVNCSQQAAVFGWQCPAGFEREIADVNRLLAAQAQQAGVPFVDLGADLRSPDGALDPAFGLDGLHLNGLAYQRWVAAWKTAGW